MLFKGIGELIPFYGLYALLFADHGLSTAQLSSLFAIWSVPAFLLEVPSGTWRTRCRGVRCSCSVAFC